MQPMCCFSSDTEAATLGELFSVPLDEGLGHSFCYIRPQIPSSSSFSTPTDTSFSISQSSEETPALPTPTPANAIPEKSFKSISGASVSANTSTPPSIQPHQQFNFFPIQPSAVFESTPSFTALPLQPAPRGSLLPPLSISCPLDRSFLSEPAFMSGPLERGFMSGPLERSHIFGSLDPISSAHFANQTKAQSLARLVRALTRPAKKFLRRTLSRVFSRKAMSDRNVCVDPKEGGAADRDVGAAEKSNLQWAQATAGEDRVHIVLCEEHGWLFVGIYDGFNGPDAPDFLMSHLYPAIHRELEGLLWDQTSVRESSDHSSNQQKTAGVLGVFNSWIKYLNAGDGDARAAGSRPAAEAEKLQLRPHRDGGVDHYVVLKALSRALKATEKSYLAMADSAAAENPELALVGSCVLVMLMKDEDVYIMNVGDSRALLASQQASSPTLESSNLTARGRSHAQFEDLDRISARDSMLRTELDRIIEETPTELEEQSFDPAQMTPPAISPTLDALQLTSDHSTSIQQEVIRIMMEHPDDGTTFCNDRVKGKLKVTRAFGAGFLKNPKWNDALLETFRIDYVGTAPYINCVPSMHHHKLGPQDRFLVLSSDGLYQYLTNEEVIAHVEWFMEKFPEGDPAQHLIEELLFRAAKKAGMDFHELLEIPQGDRRKYHDDVSVMVISVEGRVWRSFS